MGNRRLFLKSVAGFFAAPPVLSGVRVKAAQWTLKNRRDAEWTLYHGTLDNQRYSALTQLNQKTVDNLQVAWTFQVGTASPPESALQCTPTVSDGIMYVTSPIGEVFALSAGTGKIVWSHNPVAKLAPPYYDGVKSRGVVIADGKVYLATLDCRLVVLDAKTGRTVDTFGDKGAVQIADLEKGYSQTAPPTICDGKVLIGVACGEYPTRGFFSAYDANTGSLIWRWHTIPAPSDPGGSTWPNDETYKTGGGSTWMPAAVDAQRGLVILGVGNPNPDMDGKDREGDNLYTCCIVALELRTGKLKWHFQMVKHDLWDYDQASSPLLFTVHRNGREIAAVGAASKTGWFYILDRESGQSLLPTREAEVPQNERHHTSRTQTFLDVPPFVEHRNIFAPPTPEGVLIAPGLWGGTEWNPVSYSPQTGYVYVSAIDCPMIFKNDLTEPSVLEKPPSNMHLGGDFVLPPNTLSRGAFVAIDVSTGLVKWRTPTEPHPIGGTVATGGGLVFAGEADGYFIALDARTGKRLWQFYCGAGVNAAAMTYEVSGRQYVAVAAGGWGGNAFGKLGEKYHRSGSTIFAFSLPDRARHQ